MAARSLPLRTLRVWCLGTQRAYRRALLPCGASVVQSRFTRKPVLHHLALLSLRGRHPFQPVRNRWSLSLAGTAYPLSQSTSPTHPPSVRARGTSVPIALTLTLTLTLAACVHRLDPTSTASDVDLFSHQSCIIICARHHALAPRRARANEPSCHTCHAHAYLVCSEATDVSCIRTHKCIHMHTLTLA